jgi:hypothetical protein
MIPASVKDYSFDSDRAQLAISRIMSVLPEGSMLSCMEIGSAIHKSKTSTGHYLLYLRGNEEMGWPRRIFIADWRQGSGRHTPLYAKGDKPDKKEPKQMTNKQRGAKRRARELADPVKHEANKARRREIWNSPRPRETSLSNRILRYLANWPGKKSAEIALALHADLRCTVTNLQRLRHGGKVMVLPAKGKKRALYWHVAPTVSTPDHAKPIIVKQWVTPKVAPQGIFAALGI